MKFKKRFPILIIVIITVLLLLFAVWKYYFDSINIKNIILSSPHNSALLEDIKISLNKSASIFIRYWEVGSQQNYETPVTSKSFNHIIHLVLLKPNTTYKYQLVIIRPIINRTSKTSSFHTRKQSPWLIHNWVNNKNIHDPKVLRNGLIMLCYGGIPGYITMVDGKGKIRWYWQVDNIGVRAATLTPRGTILALLHHPDLDEINDISNDSIKKNLNNMHAPIRRGRIGYAGGTAIAEITLTGQQLWRLNINKDSLGYFCIHHDLRMDKDYHILALTRDPLIYNTTQNISGIKKDTLWGDALVKIDSTGKILWKWSTWDNWNIQQDTKIKKLWYDRFHLNAVWICKDGNYMVSSALENQIWKIDSQSKKVIWKLGEGGNFKMPSSSYFAFQHDVNINKNGDLMIFDNGDFSPLNKSSEGKNSRVLAFHLDTTTMIATTKLSLNLPHYLYSSRMGSAYMLPYDNLLITSSKTRTVIIMSTKGKILLELDLDFIPYRAEYVPASFWRSYFSPV